MIYELRVRSFTGTRERSGDFRGLTRRLEYLKRLGADCLWLIPIHPSPLEDDGYDVADYCAVHPDYGTLEDFKAFLAEAHRLGLKVLMDLVLNHTSERHAWFEESRSSKEDPKRDWYVWRKDNTGYSGIGVIFRNKESDNWEWDPRTGEYYWHRFYKTQPDLNFENPEVVEATLDVADFWLGLGVDGFRLDAIHCLYEKEGTSCEHLPETHAYLKKLRRFVDGRHEGKVLLAETVGSTDKIRPYFSGGDECHMAFHFPLAAYLFYGLATEDAGAVRRCFEGFDPLPEDCAWGFMLRNHDDLAIKFLTEEERSVMKRAYAPKPGMVLNDGIRRRLSPLLGDDPSDVRLAHALILSLPGSPVLYYGDEIGMGEDLSLPDRFGLRTPMDWDEAERQERDPASLLSWLRKALSIRKAHPALVRGECRFLDPGNPKVLAFERSLGGRKILAFFNLGRSTERAGTGMTERVSVGDLWTGETRGLDPRVPLPPRSFSWFELPG